MTDLELRNIYEIAYIEEFNKNMDIVNSLTAPARDKKYALELCLGIFTLVSIVRNASEIEKEITQTFDHNFKLGGFVSDTIRAIPDIIEKHRRISEERRKTHKKEVSVEWKKIFGFIPYAVKHVNIKSNFGIGSSFESLETDSEIASELGRQRSLTDLMYQLEVKYFELGGLEDYKSGEASLIPFDTLVNLKSALSNNNLDLFVKTVQSIFATMSYDMKISEGFFQSHIHLLLTLLDIKILSELETNKGRIDSVVESQNYIHIIEFKQNDSTVALEQIKQKEYYQRFLNTKKKIILVGIAVDKSERNIIDWQMQSYN